MRRWVVAAGALVFAGCVSSRVVPGQPMSRLPPGLAWCDAGASPVDRPEAGGSGHFPGSAFRGCRAVLFDEDPNAGLESWRAKMVFGLTTDDAGRVTDVCLWSAELGDPVRFVSCIADVLRTYPAAMPARMKKDPYTVWYFID